MNSLRLARPTEGGGEVITLPKPISPVRYPEPGPGVLAPPPAGGDDAGKIFGLKPTDWIFVGVLVFALFYSTRR